jgi:hypothetical protein
MATTQKLSEFLELINLYPSPHNGQPMRLKVVDDQKFAIFFERERGLQSTEISFLFSYVSIGIFTRYAELCGEALGHRVDVTPELPEIADIKGSGLVKCGILVVDWDSVNPNEAIKTGLINRQTSRKKYSGGLDEITHKKVEECVYKNMNLVKLSKSQAHDAIWLNQRAVFDDMFEEEVRKELDHWLRYSKKEKKSKMDGLAYDCMELNGRLMKFIVNHPKFLRYPVIDKLIRSYYLRTMKDASDVYYMLAPFKEREDAYNIGRVTMDVWAIVSASGYYLHPFGTIMSNEDAHRDFAKLANIQNETREASYLVFIFRTGSSEKPARSMRIPVNQHLLIQGDSE